MTRFEKAVGWTIIYAFGWITLIIVLALFFHSIDTKPKQTCINETGVKRVECP